MSLTTMVRAGISGRLFVGMLTALMFTTLWAAVATYQWVTLRAQAPLQCDNKVLADNLKGVEAALGTMSEQVAQAAEFSGIELKKTNAVVADLGKAFTPIEESLNEAPVVVPAACTGTFPAGVRDALSQAVAEANR